MTRVTRDDVARRAGTSPAVVSYVINNGPRPVAASTRARVEAAMEELGYRPNLVARALRSSRSNTIGLIIPDSTEAFFTELTHAVEQAAFAQGSLVLFGNTGFSPEVEQRYVDVLAGMQVDGLLLVRAEVGAPRTAAPQRQRGVPVVYLNHRAPRGAGATSVVLANRDGGVQVGRHLVEHGYRRIGCVTGSARSGPVADRARGWAEAVREAGLDAGDVLRTGLDRRSARTRIRDWLSRRDRPQAVMATADGLGQDVLSVAQELGLRVPGDLAVFGFGRTSAAAHTWPGLSTAGHPIPAFGRAAVETLHTVQATGQRAADVVLDVDLVRRASCGCDDATDDEGTG